MLHACCRIQVTSFDFINNNNEVNDNYVSYITRMIFALNLHLLLIPSMIPLNAPSSLTLVDLLALLKGTKSLNRMEIIVRVFLKSVYFRLTGPQYPFSFKIPPRVY